MYFVSSICAIFRVRLNNQVRSEVVGGFDFPMGKPTADILKLLLSSFLISSIHPAYAGLDFRLHSHFDEADSIQFHDVHLRFQIFRSFVSERA